LCFSASLPFISLLFLFHSVWHLHWHLSIYIASEMEGSSTSFHCHLNSWPR
jgi:hypothetical protein